jgi:hypothetical protein
MPGSPMSRRHFLATLGLALAGAACTGKGTNERPPATPNSIDALRSGSTPVSLYGSADTHNPVNPGENRFAFALVTATGGVITGGSPQIYIARTRAEAAQGPFPGTGYPFSGYDKTGDRSPRSPVPGTYSATIQVPSAGNWLVLGVAQSGGQTQAGLATFVATATPAIASVGSKAISTRTPVGTKRKQLAQICTRVPPDDMHSISLDQALTNGKPTVVVFATPLLCESRLCGPVVDEQILVFEKYGPDKANFIHVEEFLPGPQLQPPAATLENRSPAFKAWGFESEPWVLVIDRGGTIRSRMGPGPATAAEIEAALTPLL